jgi:hypothetical protein
MFFEHLFWEALWSNAFDTAYDLLNICCHLLPQILQDLYPLLKLVLMAFQVVFSRTMTKAHP